MTSAEDKFRKMRDGSGFIAALDQSGGSTPKALADYGIPEDAYDSEEKMFDLVHEMRSRIITNKVFTGERILGAILFIQTMERDMEGIPTPTYLWERKGVIPFLKVDNGMEDKESGVQLMKEIDDLDEKLEKAKAAGVFGTKMRSVIHEADKAGIAAIADQQFRIARQISDAGLVPIIEPEVDIDSKEKKACEELLCDSLLRHLHELPDDKPVMLKLTLPEKPGFHKPLIEHPRVLRVVALSGGYDRDEANDRLARNPGLIASFSRALLEGLSAQQSDEEFTQTLDQSITSIYEASTT